MPPIPARLCAALLSLSLLQAQDSSWIRPVPGALVLAASDRSSDCVYDMFLHLAGGRHGRIAILGGTPNSPIARHLRQRGVKPQLMARALPGSGANRETSCLALMEMDGVWLTPEVRPGQERLLAGLLRNLLERGRVLGAAGDAARRIASLPRRSGSVLMPGLKLSTGPKDPQAQPGQLRFRMDPHTALVISRGRWLCGYGQGDIQVSVAPTKSGWPALQEGLEVIDAYDPGDEPSYSLDLLAWLRAARDRRGPVFPPANPKPPILSRGTLILQGGGGVSDETFAAFIAAAGGKQARFVCIPTSGNTKPGQPLRSYSARKLRARGCSRVQVLHTRNPEIADRDPVLREMLRQAGGCWIDGGRTFNFMDAYQGTAITAELRALLTRGGVLGGSSAGCQVAGAFLVRGDPRSNKVIEMAGYTRGLDLLYGVVLDAHFLQRRREQPFQALLGRHPQLLGIGVDEKTAIQVRGSLATVLGKHQVSFYDPRRGGKAAITRLRSGQSYDLRRRRARR